ncbi:peptidase S28 [Favolaschia claudopus]|uniref:Peptidase S28 n=1 Tax=Favolaschia claudopus TaxID=2862362 RepID=A0AAV9ZBA2_9AGAR
MGGLSGSGSEPLSQPASLGWYPTLKNADLWLYPDCASHECFVFSLCPPDHIIPMGSLRIFTLAVATFCLVINIPTAVSLVPLPHLAIGAVTTKTSTCSSPAEQIFNQLIDHSNASDGSTFPQRVQVNTTFYKAGGPLFILQGDESTDMTCAEFMEFSQWAPEFHAATMVIEHHYFGQSQPFGNNSYTNHNMRFLTLDNVMSDTVAVVNWWRNNLTDGAGKDAPVIVFGGSYAGSIATILRINYPQIFFGALASAPPLRTFLPVTDDPDRFNRYNLKLQPKFAPGFNNSRRSSMWVSNYTEIPSIFAVCTTPKEEDRDEFLRSLAAIYSLVLQANTAYLGPLFNLTGFPFDAIASRTLAASSPLAAVNETFNALCYSSIASNGCFDWTNQCSDSVGAQLVPLNYLRCSYMNYDYGDVAPGSMFAPTAPYDSTQYCQATFGITPPTKEELFAKYHFDEATIRQTTRVIYSQGPDQSWFPIASTDPNASRYLYCDYAAHTQDLIMTFTGNDDPSLLRMRDQEKNIIKGWLKAAS